MITYTCGCGAILSIPDEYAGKGGESNKCNTQFFVHYGASGAVQRQVGKTGACLGIDSKVQRERVATTDCSRLRNPGDCPIPAELTQNEQYNKENRRNLVMSEFWTWVLVIYAGIAGLITLPMVRPPFINWYKSTSFFIAGRSPVDILMKSVGYRLGFELFVYGIACVVGGLGLWIVSIRRLSSANESD